MNRPLAIPAADGVTELMVLADGRVLAHGLTREAAAVLAALDPADNTMRRRSRLAPAPDEIPCSSTKKSRP